MSGCSPHTVMTRRAFHSSRSRSAGFRPPTPGLLEPAAQEVLRTRGQQLVHVADELGHAPRGRLQRRPVFGSPSFEGGALQIGGVVAQDLTGDTGQFGPVSIRAAGRRSRVEQMVPSHPQAFVTIRRVPGRMERGREGVGGRHLMLSGENGVPEDRPGRLGLGVVGAQRPPAVVP